MQNSTDNPTHDEKIAELTAQILLRKAQLRKLKEQTRQKRLEAYLKDLETQIEAEATHAKIAEQLAAEQLAAEQLAAQPKTGDAGRRRKVQACNSHEPAQTSPDADYHNGTKVW